MLRLLVLPRIVDPRRQPVHPLVLVGQNMHLHSRVMLDNLALIRIPRQEQLPIAVFIFFATKILNVKDVIRVLFSVPLVEFSEEIHFFSQRSPLGVGDSLVRSNEAVF